MSNKNYVNGAAFERKTINNLKQKGYYCMRSAGSRGIFDIIAIDFRLGEVKLIQLKNYRLSPGEYQKIVDDINELGSQPAAEIHFYTLEHTGRGTDRMVCIK